MRDGWGRSLLLLAAMASGCAPGGGDDDATAGRSLVAPTFPPVTAGPAGDPSASAPSAPAGSSTASPASPGVSTSPGTSTAGDPIAAAGAGRSVSVTDPAGDLTASPADPAPAWADLRGATLRRAPVGFELAIDLAGPAPARAPDAEHTMNIASFYDLDGDGRVDVEIWVTLADDGWGGAHFDDRAHTATFARDSRVEARAEGGRVIVAFPAAHLDDAAAFRWSLASEWGRFEVIGSSLAARDDVPDHDAAVDFPG